MIILLLLLDIVSPLSQPPAPSFTFSAQPRRRLDGTIGVDGVLNFRNELAGYNQDLRTEYFISRPDGATLVNNVTLSSSPFHLTLVIRQLLVMVKHPVH